MVSHADVELFDTHASGTVQSSAFRSPLHSQVVQFDPTDTSKIIGDLAESWKISGDGMTYTFSLHDNVEWWDGTDLTSEDVAFSINRWIEPGEPRPRTGLLRPYIDRAEVVDRNTVDVHLKFPAAAMLGFMGVDFMLVFPKAQADIGYDTFDKVMGSGPFRVTEWQRGSFYTFEKNPTYFKEGMPYIDGYTATHINDAGTIVAGYRTGRLQMAHDTIMNLSIEDALVLDAVPGLTSHFTEVNTMQGVIMNAEKEPFDDARVRRALWLAIDRWELVDTIGGGKYVVGSPFPPGQWYSRSVAELEEFPGFGRGADKQQDIDQAVELLKQAGFDPPSELGTLELLAGVCCLFPDWATLAKEQWRRNLGIDTNIAVKDMATVGAAQSGGNYTIGISGYGVNVLDPDDFLNAQFMPTPRAWSRWSDPTFIELFNRQSRESDLATRKQILLDMEEFLLTNGHGNIVFTWRPWFNVVSDKIRTEAGSYVAPNTIQIALKNEHIWLEE